MSTTPTARAAVDVISIGGDFRRSDARELARRVHTALGAGEHRFVVDLTAARGIAEGALVLSLLGVRAALARVDGRLVVAAGDDVAHRLADVLRLDDVLGVAGSRREALAVAARAEPA
jgi:hypothetical protein